MVHDRLCRGVLPDAPRGTAKRRSISFVICLAAFFFAQAALAQPAPVSADAEPNVADVRAGDLDLSAESLSRGSYSLPSVMSVSPTRSLPLIDVFPTYSPDAGPSEWGLGWSAPQLRLVRRQPQGAARFDDTDVLVSPWGLLRKGDDGRYYPESLRSHVTASVQGSVVTVTDAADRTFVFGGDLRTIEGSGGVVVWMLSQVRNRTGDQMDLEYEVRNNRALLSHVTWSRHHEAASELTLDCKLVYENTAPVLDNALGVKSILDRRLTKVWIWVPLRTTGALTLVQYYDLHYDPAHPWQMVRVDEHHGVPAPEITRSWTYTFGPSWPTDATAARPPEQVVVEAAKLPTWDDPTVGPSLGLDHAMTSRVVISSDFENDGVSDFLAFLSSKTVWWRRDTGGYRDWSQTAGNAPDRCRAFAKPPIVTTVRAGEVRPSLFSIVPSASDPTAVSITRCGDDGVVLMDQTIHLQPYQLSECPFLGHGAEARSRAGIADLNGDGVADLFFLDQCSIFFAAGNFAAPGTSGLGFDPVATRVALPGLEEADSAQILDVNGDGVADVLVSGPTESKVWFGIGSGDGRPLFTLGAERLPFVNDDPARPSGCETMFAQLDEEPFIDLVASCWINTEPRTYYYKGSAAGFRLVRREALSGKLVRASLGAPYEPGITFSEHFQRTRASSAEPCPEGSRPSAVPAVTNNGYETLYYCSPVVRHQPVQRPETGRLTSFSSSDGETTLFEYAYAAPSPGLGHRRVVLSAITSFVGGRDARRREMQYELPAEHITRGTFLGFSKVTVAEYNLTSRTKGLAVRYGYRSTGDVFWNDTTESVAADGTTWLDVTHGEPDTFHGVPWLRIASREHSGRDGAGNLVRLHAESWHYAPGSLCPDEHRTTYGPAGGPKLLEKLDYDTNWPANASIACRVAVSRLSSDGMEPIEHVYAYDPNGLLALEAISGGPGPYMVPARRTYEQGLLVREETPGNPPRIITYEQGQGGVVLRLVAREESGKKAARYFRDPLLDRVEKIEVSRGPKVYTQGFAYDALGRVTAEWASTRGGPTKPWRTRRYWDPYLNHPAGVLVEEIADATAKQRTIELYASDGTTIARGQQWSAASPPEYRFELTRREPDRFATAEGGLLAVGAPELITFADVAPEALGTITEQGTTPYLGRSAEWTSRVAPGVVTRWSRSGALGGDGVQATVVSRNGIPIMRMEADPTRLTETTDRQGSVTILQRDALSRSVHVRLPDGSEQAQTFDGYGRVSAITRGNIRRSFTYASFRNAQGILEYTERPSCVRTIDTPSGKGFERCVGWTPDWQPTGISSGPLPTGGSLDDYTKSLCHNTRIGSGQSGSDDYVYSYDDSTGDLVGVRGPGFRRALTYDVEGRVESETIDLLQPGGQAAWRTVKASLGYFTNGGVRGGSTDVFAGAQAIFHEPFTLGLDAAGLPARLEVGGAVIKTTRRPDQTVYTFATGESLTYAHGDAVRSIDGVTASAAGGAPLFSSRGTRDADGHVAKEEFSFGADRESYAYTYDRDRLIKADYVSSRRGTSSVTYSYDASGLLNFRYGMYGEDPVRRGPGVLQASGWSWQLDAFGRIIGASSGETYCWGDSNELQTVSLPGSSGSETSAQIYYDDAGHRLFSARWGAGHMSLSGNIGHLSIDDTGVKSALSLGGRLVGSLEGGHWIPALFDDRGSQRGAAGGDLVHVEPYGEREGLLVNDGDARLPAFAEGMEEGAPYPMVRLGQRDYVPAAGQFAQPDELFLGSLELCASKPFGCNLFGYTPADPINFVDPSGLLECIATDMSNGECVGTGTPTYSSPTYSYEYSFSAQPTGPGTRALDQGEHRRFTRLVPGTPRGLREGEDHYEQHNKSVIAGIGRAWSAEETDELIRSTAREYASQNALAALRNMAVSHARKARFDFVSNHLGDTFMTTMGPIPANEFGNYFIGLQSTLRFGDFGFAGARAAGHFYGIWDGLQRGVWQADDAGSIEALRRGRFDASSYVP